MTERVRRGALSVLLVHAEVRHVISPVDVRSAIDMEGSASWSLQPGTNRAGGANDVELATRAIACASALSAFVISHEHIINTYCQLFSYMWES